VTLEEPFWQALRELATVRGLSVSSLIRSVASERGQGNLSSALRVFVLEHFRTAAYERDALGGPSGWRHQARRIAVFGVHPYVRAKKENQLSGPGIGNTTLSPHWAG
jgi:predicted DNA-binding ribbon-helix-helix protein